MCEHKATEWWFMPGIIAVMSPFGACSWNWNSWGGILSEGLQQGLSFSLFFFLKNKKALSLPVWAEWYCPRQKGPHRPSYSCSTRLLGPPSSGRDGEQNQGNCSACLAISMIYIGFAWQSWRRRGRKGRREKGNKKRGRKLQIKKKRKKERIRTT